MTTTQTVPTQDIKPGDTITHVDGHPVPPRPKVTEFVGVAKDGTVEVKVEQRPGAMIVPNRYLRYREVTVERPAKAKRVVTRTIDGIKWIKREDGWISEDGRFEIVYQDDFETECECAHPVRISAAMRKDIRNRPSFWPIEARWAVQDGKRGYQCGGGEVHTYAQWVGGTEEDVVTRDDTFADAARNVARYAKTGVNNA